MKPYDRDVAELLESYSEFARVDVDDLREAFIRRQELINDEWNAMPAKDWRDKATRFYCESKHYHLELLASGPTAEYAADKLYDLGLGDYLEIDGKLRILELGSGFGFSAEALAKRGHDVTCVDVPGASRAFAEWRLRQQGVAVLWLSPDEIGRDATYDLVFSDAVFEHLVDPYGVATNLCRRLTPAGLMHHSIDLVNRGLDWPMHRWIDLQMLDDAVAAAGGALKWRSPNGISSQWTRA